MKKKFLLIFSLVYMLTAWANLAFAQNSGYDYTKAGVGEQIKQYLCAPTPQTSTNSASSTASSFNNNAASSDLYNCINRLYKFAIVLASVIGVFFIVISGYLYMSAEGSQEAVDKAKSILVSTITSLVILFGGYVLLKALNPDLVQFRSIQPPSVVVPNAPSPDNVQVSLNGTNPGTSAPTQISGGVGTTAASQILSAGCTFQTQKQNDEAQYMTQALLTKIVGVCQSVSSGGAGKPAISSVIGQGQHAYDSYHYKGCAIDFADGFGNGFFDFNTKTGRPIGVAIYNAAKAQGFSDNRIDPDTDRNQTYHIHVDLGSSCPSK